MKYLVEVLIKNLETDALNISQRVVSVERERSPVYPNDPLPIDSDQKDSLLRWAIEQAAKDAIKDRDRVRHDLKNFTQRPRSDLVGTASGGGA